MFCRVRRHLCRQSCDFDKDSHAIVVTPNYQSHETLPASIASVSAVLLREEEGWALDIEEIGAAIRPNTKLVTINFPHNPTGAILPLDRYMALIELCRKHGIHILHDEIFNGLGPTGTKHLPFIADVYERGLSLGVMSKSYGSRPRIGWIACRQGTIIANGANETLPVHLQFGAKRKAFNYSLKKQG